MELKKQLGLFKRKAQSKINLTNNATHWLPSKLMLEFLDSFSSSYKNERIKWRKVLQILEYLFLKKEIIEHVLVNIYNLSREYERGGIINPTLAIKSNRFLIVEVINPIYNVGLIKDLVYTVLTNWYWAIHTKNV